MDNRALDKVREMDSKVDEAIIERDKALEKLVGREAICTKGSSKGYWVKITGFTGDRIIAQNLKSGKISRVCLSQITDLE